MANVQESIAVGRTQRNLRKPSWLITNTIVAYALPVIGWQSRLLMGAENSLESKMWRMS